MTEVVQVHMLHAIAVEDKHHFSQNNYFQDSAGSFLDLDIDVKHVHTYHPYTYYSHCW